MTTLPIDIQTIAAGRFDPAAAMITQLRHEEDDEPYSVWRIEAGAQSFILKEAKEYESEVYRTFLSDASGQVPAIYGAETVNGKTYLLMEYIEGRDLCRCDRHSLQQALDALIALQRTYWGETEKAEAGFSYEKSRAGRKKRGTFLREAELEEAYEGYLALYERVPRTLCHDDLLPFNVRIDERSDRGVLIDWEYGGILPYPTSLARLLAFGEEKEDAFFYMKDEDKAFASEYYYENLLKDKGIAKEEWQRTLAYFLLYEYCEWVAVGHQYEEPDNEYFIKYQPVAKAHAKRLLHISREMEASAR